VSRLPIAFFTRFAKPPQARGAALLVAVALAAVSLGGPGVQPVMAADTPMPPQLPSPAEMARLTAQMEGALAEVRQAQAQLDQVVRAFDAANDRLAKVVGEAAASQERLGVLEAELEAARARMNLRAASVYRSERLQMLGVLVAARSFRQFLTAFGMLESVSEQDADAVTRVSELRSEQQRLHSEINRQRQEQHRVLADVARRQEQVEASLQAVNREYQAIKAEVDRRRSGFAFPVGGAYSYTNTFGAPRMVGTEYYHRHEGTDVFALKGTPVVSVVDGVLERVGTDRLGGIKLWVRSPGDNWSYYYAHLSGYARGVRNGLPVKKGQVVGYIGNTGNARSTPAHLHFETHLPGGKVVNSYFVLRRCDPLAR
jgi:murein DD-endopeptidase MepM/ murein hydrolase activator NlpD